MSFVSEEEQTLSEEEIRSRELLEGIQHWAGEAASCYNMHEEFWMTLLQFIQNEYGDEALKKAAYVLSCEWDV